MELKAFEVADNIVFFCPLIKTFKGKKLMEGLQSASQHQNGGQLELVSIHN